MSELDLLVVGDANPDVILAEVRDIRFGQAETMVDRAGLVLGGSAAITACGVARLGLQVGLCAVVGADRLGDLTRELLVDSGVDLRHTRVDPDSSTGLSVILQCGEDRAILTAAGAIQGLSESDLVALPDRPAQHVHVASYFLMSKEFRDALPTALRRFRAQGVTTSLDTNWDPTGDWDLGEVLQHIDVFLPNEAELQALAGADVATASRLLGCEVVMKRGARGAVSSAGVAVDARPSPRFVDAVGAGDSFNAGLLAGRLTGASEMDALRLAVAVGTLSTCGVGGTAAQPDMAQARAWITEGES